MLGYKHKVAVTIYMAICKEKMSGYKYKGAPLEVPLRGIIVKPWFGRWQAQASRRV
jgi:hypothetical protein